MNISLTPELEQIVTQKVNSGLYTTPLEVIHEALRALDNRDASHQAWIEEVSAQVTAGLAQLRRGEGISGDQVFEELRQKSQQLRQERVQA